MENPNKTGVLRRYSFQFIRDCNKKEKANVMGCLGRGELESRTH